MAATPDVSTTTRSLLEGYAEGLRYFMGRGTVNYALEQLVADLQRHEIDYAVTGGVALFAHGYERVTENINLILTVEGSRSSVKNYSGGVLSEPAVTIRLMRANVCAHILME